jgi:hypothetical protein
VSGKMEPGAPARIFSGILGLLFVGIGLVAHGRQTTPDRPTLPSRQLGPSASEQPADAPHMPRAESLSCPSESLSHNPALSAKKHSKLAIQTKFEGIRAMVTRFERRGRSSSWS